jgi:hypothetical protein
MAALGRSTAAGGVGLWVQIAFTQMHFPFQLLVGCPCLQLHMLTLRGHLLFSKDER